MIEKISAFKCNCWQGDNKLWDDFLLTFDAAMAVIIITTF